MPTWSNESKSVANTAKCTLCDGGFLRLYTAGFAVLLVEIPLPNPCFAADVNGTAVSNAISSASAVADGDIAAARIYKSDGVSIVLSTTSVGLISDPDPSIEVRVDALTATTGQDVTINPITFSQG